MVSNFMQLQMSLKIELIYNIKVEEWTMDFV